MREVAIYGVERRAERTRRQVFALLGGAGLGAGLGALGGCGTGGAPAATREGHAPATSPSAYLLGAGDKLRINVFGEADLSGEFTVGPSGAIAYPLIGDVSVAGQSATQFAAALQDRLRAGYVREPKISVDVITFRPFYILGEVQEPGTFAFSANLTVMNAVAMAKGFTYRADTRRVFIKHDGARAEVEYPLTSMTTVQPGDTVRISERRF